MNLRSPHQHEATVQPLSPQTETTCKTEQDKLLQLYCSLPAEERDTQFLSTASIAEKYGLPPRTVQHWIDYRWIAALKIGRKYKVYAPSVIDFLHRCARQREMS
jgi:hypothetical protein